MKLASGAATLPNPSASEQLGQPEETPEANPGFFLLIELNLPDGLVG